MNEKRNMMSNSRSANSRETR